MTASQMHAPTGYGRRMAVSLVIAIGVHVLLLLIPIYRLIGTNPGSAGGSGGGSNPFVGALMGSSVIIRTPEFTGEDVQPAAATDNTPLPPTPVTVAVDLQESTETTEPMDDENFAIEVIPPATHTRGTSRNHRGAIDGTGVAFGGSLKLLGGGGVAIEMDLEPRKVTMHSFLTEIVTKRKIESQMVRVQVLVDVDGLVIDHRVLMSIPNCPECTAEAIRSVYKYEFPQPIFEGERVRAWVTLGLTFGM